MKLLLLWWLMFNIMPDNVTSDWISRLLWGEAPEDTATRVMTRIVLASLFLLGALHWVVFLREGHLNFTFLDWNKFNGFLFTVRQALVEQRIPFYIADPVQGASRFLANPEVALSPQMILLWWFPVGTYILLNTLLHYTVGFVGCVLLRKKYRLGLLPFTIFFLIFNFNGFVISHISVGHLSFYGYFFLPLFLLLLFEWPEARPTTTKCASLSLVFAAMLLQGSFHIVFWCLAFVALTAAFAARGRALLSLLGFTGLLGAVRLVPAAFTYSGYATRFLGGFPTLLAILDGLVSVRDFSFKEATLVCGWWEYDFFVGLIAVAFLAYYGVWKRMSCHPEPACTNFETFDWPIAIFTALSLDHVWGLAFLPLPFVGSESVTSRFLVLPLLVLTLIATVRLQRDAARSLLRTHPAWSLILLAEMGVEFLRHSVVWRLSSAESSSLTTAGDFASQCTIITRPDASYALVEGVSLFLSLFGFGVVLWLIARDAKSRRDLHRVAIATNGAP